MSAVLLQWETWIYGLVAGGPDLPAGGDRVAAERANSLAAFDTAGG